MSRVRIPLLILALLAMASACIKPYAPEIQSRDLNKYVVTGQVTAGDSTQTVNVSRTSSISDPKYIPVSGCTIIIFDDKGNEFPLTEKGNGDYFTVINPDFLIPGVSFRIEVTIPSGDLIRSEFDKLSDCPAVDSIYYIRKDIPGNKPGQFTRGIQFYTDLNTTASYSRYYRWETTETWEYHTDYPLEWYYDGTTHQVVPPDYSRNVCWSTYKIPDIFTLSTADQDENKYNMLPLHYVNNRTSRLMYGYSLLIKQYSLSEAAYVYWDQLRINGSQEGGLYTTQPLPIQGNMYNVTNPSEGVLGYFGATSMKSKRIFIQNVPGLVLDFSTGCSLERPPWGPVPPDEYPIYLVKDSNGQTIYHITEDCINCLLYGGTTVKPSFWPY